MKNSAAVKYNPTPILHIMKSISMTLMALMAAPVILAATSAETDELKSRADKGDTEALNAIVKLCEQESDTLTDREKVRYCLKAGGKSNYDAQLLLYAYFSQGKHTPQNPVLAKTWEEGILNSGSGEAVFALAKWKMNNGASREERQAGQELCKKAAAMNCTEAKEYLETEAKRIAEEARLAAERQARASGPLSDSNVLKKVSSYLRARAYGDGSSLSSDFASSVVYKYSGKNAVSRDTVLRDIESGWQRWVSRSYRVISVGVKGRTVEVIFFYNLVDNTGKSASGYSKEIWQLNESAQIVTWDEQLSKTAEPKLSAGFDSIY